MHSQNEKEERSIPKRKEENGRIREKDTFTRPKGRRIHFQKEKDAVGQGKGASRREN